MLIVYELGGQKLIAAYFTKKKNTYKMLTSKKIFWKI